MQSKMIIACFMVLATVPFSYQLTHQELLDDLNSRTEDLTDFCRGYKELVVMAWEDYVNETDKDNKAGFKEEFDSGMMILKAKCADQHKIVLEKCEGSAKEPKTSTKEAGSSTKESEKPSKGAKSSTKGPETPSKGAKTATKETKPSTKGPETPSKGAKTATKETKPTTKEAEASSKGAKASNKGKKASK